MAFKHNKEKISCKSSPLPTTGAGIAQSVVCWAHCPA